MECKNCPYGEEYYELIRRYNPDSAEDELQSYIYCEKIGGRVWMYGYCGEKEDVKKDQKLHINKKKRNKRERDLKYKQHLKTLNSTQHRYSPSGVYLYIPAHNQRTKSNKPYYKRYYCSKRAKYLKRLSNRAIRRYKGELHNGRHCYKVFEFWYQLC